MNIKQLYTIANNDERNGALEIMLQVVEAHKRKKISVRGRFIIERRGQFRGAHFLNDRRRLRPTLKSALALSSFAFILTTVSVATWLFAIHAPAPLAAAAISIHVVMLSLILYIKPYNVRLQTT